MMQPTDLTQLFMQAPVAICIVSGPTYKVELVNEQMLQFLGRTPDIIGMPLQQTLTEAREQGLLAILEKVRSTGESFYVNNFSSVILINGVREPRYFNLVFKPYFMTSAETKPTGIFCIAHNVTSAVLAHQKLEEEKRRTALALETGELGMLSTNWETSSVIADRRANEIFGFEDSQTLETYLTRIHPDDRPLRDQAITEGAEKGSFDFDVRLLLPDGTIRWMRSRGMIQKNADNKIAGSFGVVQDITAQKQFAQALQQKVEQRTAELKVANQSLQQVNNELLRSNAALEEFARAASHDLKEPVRKVQVFASRLRETLDGRLSEDEAKLFSRVENAADRMALLVDDLLEYSYLDQAPLAPEEIDLNVKLAAILSDLEVVVNEKNATVSIDPLPKVLGHRRQLQQLFQNLLSNALKYTRPGVAPHIWIKTKEVDTKDLNVSLTINTQGQRFHLIEVTDNGIGFLPDDSEKIFTVFTRLHGKGEYAGTGIGLSIAKKVVENHNGFIYATGEPGKGACFSVLLPVTR